MLWSLYAMVVRRVAWKRGVDERDREILSFEGKSSLGCVPCTYHMNSGHCDYYSVIYQKKELAGSLHRPLVELLAANAGIQCGTLLLRT